MSEKFEISRTPTTTLSRSVAAPVVGEIVGDLLDAWVENQRLNAQTKLVSSKIEADREVKIERIRSSTTLAQDYLNQTMKQRAHKVDRLMNLLEKIIEIPDTDNVKFLALIKTISDQNKQSPVDDIIKLQRASMNLDDDLTF